MPSLRRSFSSPSVRSSPYLSSTNTSTTRTRPTIRRSSASATAERRVLADIEWWRVYDGQCGINLQDRALHDLDPDAPGGTITLSAGGDFFVPSHTTDPVQYVYPNALSIAPHFPPGSRHGRDSSVESTPELSTSRPLEDLFSFPPPLARVASRPVHPLFGLRSISAPSWTHQGTLAPDLADVGGDSFSFNQSLFQ